MNISRQLATPGSMQPERFQTRNSPPEAAKKLSGMIGSRHVPQRGERLRSQVPVAASGRKQETCFPQPEFSVKLRGAFQIRDFTWRNRADDGLVSSTLRDVIGTC